MEHTLHQALAASGLELTLQNIRRAYGLQVEIQEVVAFTGSLTV